MKHKKVELVKERGRWSAKSKRDAVLRLLRGEDLDTVSRESKVTAAKLTEWREAFLASGMAGLKARETDARDEEIERLKAVLGEMTMRCELQRDAIRDRKSTRLNSSHVKISYAVFCLKKKKKKSMQN